MSACWPLQGMSVTQKSVLISLADNANDQGVCWPAIDTIAMRCCLSDRAVQKAIEWLREHGALALLRKTGRSTVYTVTPANYVDPTPERDSPPNAVHPGTVFTPESRSPTPERGSPPPPNAVHQPPNAVHPNRKEPPFEPSLNRKGAKNRTGRADDSFERFWTAWPRTPRKVAKADCKKRWERAALAEKAEVIIAHVSAMKLTKQWRDGFDPAPATYLNQRRWEDELPPTEAETAAAADQGGDWWEDSAAIERRGVELGVRPKKPEESMPHYRVLVAKAAGKGPWIDFVLRHAERTSAEFYQQVVSYFGEALMPTDFYAS